MIEREWDEVVSLINQRRSADTPLKRLMVEVRDRYEAVDYILPSLGTGNDPELPQTTPSLIADAVDSTGARAGSVKYGIFCPALDPVKATGVRSLEYAGIRRKALAATHFKSQMNLQMRRAYRQLAGYATFSMMAVPDWENECVRIEQRDAIYAYPEPKSIDDFTPPRDIGYVYGRSAAWLRSQYPNQTAEYLKGAKDDALYDVVEWIDEHQVLIGIIGERAPVWNGQQELRENGVWGTIGRKTAGLLLRKWKNHIGAVPGIAPSGVSLARAISRVARLVQMPDLLQRMHALEVMAAEKFIFPDPYILGKTGQMPTVVGGTWKDGREGEINVVLDADSVGQLQSIPGPATGQAMDRLERNFKVSSGMVPAMQGETYGALRTGRAIDSMLGASIDVHIQEMHETVEGHLPHLNAAVLEMYKTYWPDKKYVMFSGWPGDVGHVEFTPSVHFESKENVVAYPIAGADINGTTVAVAQAAGAKLISMRTAREKHPFVPDAEAEERQLNVEEVDSATKAALLQQLAGGQLDWEIASDLRDKLAEGKTWAEAIRYAHDEAKKRQAEAAAAQGAQAQTPDLALAAAQPGMDQAAAGQAAIPPTIAGPSDDQANFRQLLMAINAGSSQARDTAR